MLQWERTPHGYIEVQVRLTKANWSNFIFKNDFSTQTQTNTYVSTD